MLEFGFGAAAVKIRAAQSAGQPLEDEALVVGVIGGEIETNISGRASQTGFQGCCRFVTRTRKLSKPRMIGRLDPGANVELVMPGCRESTSPSVAPGAAVIWFAVTPVTGSNDKGDAVPGARVKVGATEGTGAEAALVEGGLRKGALVGGTLGVIRRMRSGRGGER